MHDGMYRVGVRNIYTSIHNALKYLVITSCQLTEHGLSGGHGELVPSRATTAPASGTEHVTIPHPHTAEMIARDHLKKRQNA